MKIDPYHVEVSKKQFEAILDRSLSVLERRLKSTIKNVAVVAEDVVPEKVVREMHLQTNLGLLGLYSGSPLAHREYDAAVSLPDVVTVFRLPCIMEAKESGTSIEEVVYETLWHEIGHHLGLDENGVVRKEKEGKNKNK
jgi:predicted Zn-dependent protease with MMP-like domain